MPRYENFEMPKHGYETMDCKEKSAYADDGGDDSPASFEEIERPPLRHIDKYVRAECPCFSARFTVALMTCLGFIISFGMRCNMGMAKLQVENQVIYVLAIATLDMDGPEHIFNFSAMPYRPSLKGQIRSHLICLVFWGKWKQLAQY